LAQTTLSLAGLWQLQLDPADQGVAQRFWEQEFDDTIQLPNTTARAGKGEPLTIEVNLERPAMQHLHQRHRFVGPAWYRRTVQIPFDWANRDITLTLERIIWESRVWVNGREVTGEPQISLTTPHRFDLTSWLKPGQENTITLRIDNREKMQIGVMGHSYTDETQTIWNGVIGRIELEALPKVRIEHLRLRPDFARGGVEVTLATRNGSGHDATVDLSLQAEARNFPAPALTSLRKTLTLATGEASQTVFYPMDRDFERWSELNPKLYLMRAMLAGEGLRSEMADTFGMREFKAIGGQFAINGRKTFLRGDVQCAEFPQTGHPDMTGQQWEKIFTTAKAHGLNHMRFHSWCPPQIAFATADRYGFYLHVELPNWTFKMGQNPPVDDWLKAEGARMFREYGNHPSFVMLSLGNELTGDYAKMDELIAHFRKLEPRLLFTSTTYSFSPRGKHPGANDDYFVSQETASGWVRGQGFLNNTKPNTASDYSEGLSSVHIPLVTHEVGQYVVYPNLAELPKYDSTPLRATAWEAIKADLEKKGRLDEAARYTRDSGKLAALLYKEDLERALRTKGLAGIQLLQLQDFPGQSTATVGLLDCFWDSKGIITSDAFRRFCAPTVPLARMKKFTWLNSETFEADLEVAHFAEKPLAGVTANWSLRSGTTLVGEGSLELAALPLGNGIPLGSIHVSLAKVRVAAQLTLEVSIPAAKAANSWPIWVYPALPAPSDSSAAFVVSRGVDANTLAALAAGKTVMLLPPAGAVKKPLPGRFIPVFWSPLHFPDQPGTLGATIDSTHPLWRQFPTSTHTDWQWWELTAKSIAVDLEGLDPAIAKPFRFVDKYNRNAMPSAIFEAMVGPGKLLVCTLDVESELETRIAARQLRRALFDYAASAGFEPRGRLTPDQLAALIGKRDLIVTATSEHPSHPAELAVDGDPNTFWHSDWTTGVKLPICLTLDLTTPKVIEGFTYLPRQDMVNGRIAKYATQVSLDGADWRDSGSRGEFANTKELQTVKFAKPLKARYLRLMALSDYAGKGFAAAAEFRPLIKSEGDVRDLGIVPGLNDQSK
jgi:hypothetical protein